MVRVLKYLVILSAFQIAFSVLAQDEGLYAPAPPADAAFVRIINVSQDTLALTIGDMPYGDLAFTETSPYRVVIQGDRAIQAGLLSQEFSVEVGKFYTVAVTPDSITILEDKANENRAKALLSVYNLSDIETVDLKTADGATDVILGVAKGSESSIEVNGISVALGVFSNGQALHTFDEVSLERGAAYSTIVLGTADRPTVIWVQSETTTE